MRENEGAMLSTPVQLSQAIDQMGRIQRICPRCEVAIHIGLGESCFIPRGAVHGFNNLKQTDAKALAVVTPALIGPDFFEETAAIVNAGGPPDIEKLKAVLAQHGLVATMPQGT